MRKIFTILFILNLTLGYGQYTAQDRAEKMVKEHLINSYTKENYKSFGFEDLYKTSPPDILEIEELKNKVNVLRKNNLLTDSSLSYYDSLTSLKVEAVKAKKIFSTYDIKHSFVIKLGEKNTLHFYNFELFPDGKIKDVEQIMKFEFVGNEYDWFYNYYRRSTLLIDDIEENNNCYIYLDNLIKEDTTDRIATMETVLATHATISRYGYLDTTVVQRIVAQNWLRRNISNDIKVITYSTIEVILDENEKIGSNIFVEYELNGLKDARYFEFDINYILRGAMTLKKPYTHYFLKKKPNE
ncbi:hypothetical protein N9P38_00785 [Flavobacteriales bacterium]|nr:hypothetical protein [Flavobacteriales bacterium]